MTTASRVSGWRIALGAVIPVALLALWQAVTALGWVAAYKLPTPESVVVAMTFGGETTQYPHVRQRSTP